MPPIQPSAAELAVYYDPDSLAPAALGGNHVIFVTFDDAVGVPYGATRGTTEWTVDAIRDTGVPIKTQVVKTSGVAVTDLVALLGSSASGARGSIIVEAEASPERLTRLVYYTQTLGTFGTGYLLPTR